MYTHGIQKGLNPDLTRYHIISNVFYRNFESNYQRLVVAVEIITIQFLEVKACVNSSLKSFQKGNGDQSLIFEEIVT